MFNFSYCNDLDMLKDEYGKTLKKIGKVQDKAGQVIPARMNRVKAAGHAYRERETALVAALNAKLPPKSLYSRLSGTMQVED